LDVRTPGLIVSTLNDPRRRACPGDRNVELVVNTSDFGLFVAAFGDACTDCGADLNADGIVNTTDFGLFVSAYGNTCA
jgi:hypothetical protein